MWYFHVLFCFGYTNIGIEKCERLQKSISRRDNSPADKPVFLIKRVLLKESG